jgi:hypothetical protein
MKYFFEKLIPLVPFGVLRSTEEFSDENGRTNFPLKADLPLVQWLPSCTRTRGTMKIERRNYVNEI